MKAAGKVSLNNKDYYFKEGGYQKTKLTPTIPRFGQGELAISDLSAWNYWSQSDWSHGSQQKYDIDNSKFRGRSTSTIYTGQSSHFLNYLQVPGELSLLLATSYPGVADKIFDDGYIFPNDYNSNPSCVFNGNLYVGTEHATAAKLYKRTTSSWATVTTGWTTITDVNNMAVFKSKLYMACQTSNASTDKDLQIWDGTSMTAVTDFSGVNMKLACVARDKLYVVEDDATAANGDKIYESSTGASGSFTEIYASGNARNIISLENLNGKLYFTVAITDSLVELWVYDGTSVLKIYEFQGMDNGGYLKNYKNCLYIIGNDNAHLSLYKYNEANLTRVWRYDYTDGSNVMGKYPVVHDDLLYFDDYVTDGNYVAPSYQLISDTSSNKMYPINSFDGELYFGSNDTDTSDGVIYKTDATKYAVVGTCESSIVDMNLPGVDKYFGGLTVYHDKLPANSMVYLKARIDDDTAWTSLNYLGSNDTDNSTSFDIEMLTNNIGKKIEYQLAILSGSSANNGTGDGGNTTTLTRSAYDFAANGVKKGMVLVNTTKNSWGYITNVAVGTITVSKMSYGSNANGDVYQVWDYTTTTPKIQDVIIRYIVMPVPKRKWTIDILAIDGLMGYSKPRKGLDIERELWDLASATIVRFEDIDGAVYDNRKTGSTDRGVIIEDIQTMHPFYAAPEEYIVRLSLIEG